MYKHFTNDILKAQKKIDFNEKIIFKLVNFYLHFNYILNIFTLKFFFNYICVCNITLIF